MAITSKQTAKVGVDNKAVRKQILKSMLGSFKIEGIDISPNEAIEILRKVSLSMERRDPRGKMLRSRLD